MHIEILDEAEQDLVSARELGERSIASVVVP